jgi:hypothetical protein
MTSETCDEFEEFEAELAVGLLTEPRRGQLLEHANRCPRCRESLASLAATVDLVTTAAPEAEPAVGFERRALTAMGHSGGLSVGRRPWRIIGTVAAVSVLLAGALGLGAWHARQVDRAGTVITKDLVDGSHRVVGAVTVVGRDKPTLTMTIVEPPSTIEYHCIAVDASGAMVDLGKWAVGDRGGGTWVMPLPTGKPAAVLVKDDEGTIVARAELT